MKIIFCFLLFSFSLACSANSVVNSDGVASSLMTVGYNKALDEARVYYKEKGLDYNAKKVSDTLLLLSSQLTTYLNRKNYTSFSREGKLTYFNLFLNKKLITVNDLIFQSEFDDEQDNLSCHYRYSWNFQINKNPTGEINEKCTPKRKKISFTNYTGVGNSSRYYTPQDSLTLLPYTSDTVEGIVEFIITSENDNYFARIKESVGREAKGTPYIITGIKRDTRYSKETIRDFCDGNKRQSMTASVHYYNYYSVDYDLIISDDEIDQRGLIVDGSSGDIFNQGVICENIDFTHSQSLTHEINPFIDLPVKGRFLTALAKNKIALEQFVQFLNSTWKSTSSLKGYSGIPYRKEYQVTEQMLEDYLRENNLEFTQLDLYALITNERIQLYRWDDTYNIYTQSETIVKGEKTPIDVGQYPMIALEELSPPLMEESLFPILNSFLFLHDINLNIHTQTCPNITIPFLGESISNNQYCDVIEEQKSLIKLFFTLMWSLTGLIIVFRSH